MKRVVLALLFLGLIGLHAVRADDDEESGEGEAAAAPKAKAPKAPKAAPKKAAGKKAAPLPPGDFLPEGLPPVPVKPLSSDAAALVDDDALFAKFEPKTVSGKETVEQLTAALAKAKSFLNKMRRDLEGEKVWTKNVYDIIQNYQYKYLKTIQDVKMRAKKVQKMAKLVKLIKQSALHAGVKRELARASEALEELVSRAPEGASGAVYRKIATKMHRLKKALASMPRAEHLFTDTTEKVKDILSSDVAPETGDALRALVDKPKKKKKAAAPKPAASTAAAASALKAKRAAAAALAKKAKAANGKKRTSKKAAAKKAKGKSKAVPKKKAASKKKPARKAKAQPKKKAAAADDE